MPRQVVSLTWGKYFSRKYLEKCPFLMRCLEVFPLVFRLFTLVDLTSLSTHKYNVNKSHNTNYNVEVVSIFFL